MLIITFMAIILMFLTICSLIVAFLETWDFIYDFYLEIKSKFEYPKHKVIELKFKNSWGDK